MTLHLIKIAVGIADPVQLAARQRSRVVTWEDRPVVPLVTRNRPRRAAEILDGGSLYWVVKGLVRCRQRVLGVESARDAEGLSVCRLLLDPDLVPTQPVPRRPFQGWRYLAPGDVPGDAPGGPDDLPPHLLAELRSLGLW